MRVVLALGLLCATAASAGAQPFSNASSSLAKYTIAEAMPSKACDSLASFKTDEIVSISARVVVATDITPQHCRVVGMIRPEVAFEVDLPDRWNQRFYMTGNGGLAGDPVDAPNKADRTGALTNRFLAARQKTRHRARKE